MELFGRVIKNSIIMALKELEAEQPKSDAEIEAILNRHGLKRLPDGRLVPIGAHRNPKGEVR